jgi:hypothetical protein
MKYESTLIGSDVYSEDFSHSLTQKRRREFYDAFMQAPDKDKERILELVPRNTRELYIAQWDEKLSKMSKRAKWISRKKRDRKFFNKSRTESLE